jgi:phage/plasmid-associated DNA primase
MDDEQMQIEYEKNVLRMESVPKMNLFVYDKEAKCPTWEMFLMQIFNNDLDLIHFVQKAFGRFSHVAKRGLTK